MNHEIHETHEKTFVRFMRTFVYLVYSWFCNFSMNHFFTRRHGDTEILGVVFATSP